MALLKRVYNPEEESRDLGFGTALTGQRDLRMLNRDGSFNVQRPAERGLHRVLSYHALLETSWPKFFLFVVVYYLLLNLIFALG